MGDIMQFPPGPPSTPPSQPPATSDTSPPSWLTPTMKKRIMAAVYAVVIGGTGYSANGALNGYTSWVESKQQANQVFGWLTVPIAQKDGKMINRAQLIDCAVADRLKALAADIRPEFTVTLACSAE